MLSESRIFTFIDREQGFTLSFLEGQKLIHDLAIIHNIKGKGFAYFRDCVLTLQPLISFLKPGEGLGLFIDSEDPYFRLKIETNYSGKMRTLILPENFEEFPSKISGKARLAKILPNNPTPYTSIIELKNINFHEVSNQIMKDSYQQNARVHVSESSDQSLMILRLPDLNVDKEEVEVRVGLSEYWLQLQAKANKIFSKSLTNEADIQEEFENLGLEFLSSTEVKFSCSCSRERMLSGVRSLCQTNTIDDVFDNKNELEARCDYCKTNYLIKRDEL